MKKLLNGVLAAGLLLSMSACGATSTETTTVTESESAAETTEEVVETLEEATEALEEESTSAIDDSKDPIEITFNSVTTSKWDDSDFLFLDNQCTVVNHTDQTLYDWQDNSVEAGESAEWVLATTGELEFPFRKDVFEEIKNVDGEVVYTMVFDVTYEGDEENPTVTVNSVFGERVSEDLVTVENGGVIYDNHGIRIVLNGYKTEGVDNYWGCPELNYTVINNSDETLNFYFYQEDMHVAPGESIDSIMYIRELGMSKEGKIAYPFLHVFYNGEDKGLYYVGVNLELPEEVVNYMKEN